MKKVLFTSLYLALAACSTPDSSNFRVGSIDYENLSSDHAIKEVRLFKSFVSKGQNCPLQSSSETIPPFALAGVGYVGKELIAYGKSQLEKRAEYLESDIVLNGKAILPVWPDDSDPDRAELCLLVIAGEFGDTPDDAAIERFRASQRAGTMDSYFREIMASYNQQIPGVGDVTGPFTDIRRDPSILIEIKVVPAKADSDGKWFYIATPTYMLYPSPLHMMTTSRAGRKLGVEYSIGSETGSIALDGFESGAAYESGLLQQRFSITDNKGGKATTVVTVKVVEGPDKMPTAKLMRDLAGKDAEIQAWLDEKLKELADQKANGDD